MELVEQFTGKTTTQANAPELLKRTLQRSLDALSAIYSNDSNLQYELLVNGLSIAVVPQYESKDKYCDKALMIEIKGQRRERKNKDKGLCSGIVFLVPKNFRKNMTSRVDAFFSKLKRDHSDLSKLLMISFFGNAKGGSTLQEYKRFRLPLKESIRFLSQIRSSVDKALLEI